jgi:TM2 domain-containing membrane protein YozV
MTEAAAYQPPPVPQTPPTINISATAVSTPGVPRAGTKDPTAAILLEILPAISLQTFGIGNIYAGNVLGGVLIMVAYWITCLVNLGLCVFLIGFITWPLTWLAFAVGSSYIAYHKAKATQQLA